MKGRKRLNLDIYLNWQREEQTAKLIPSPLPAPGEGEAARVTCTGPGMTGDISQSDQRESGSSRVKSVSLEDAPGAHYGKSPRQTGSLQEEEFDETGIFTSEEDRVLAGQLSYEDIFPFSEPPLTVTYPDASKTANGDHMQVFTHETEAEEPGNQLPQDDFFTADVFVRPGKQTPVKHSSRLMNMKRTGSGMNGNMMVTNKMMLCRHQKGRNNCYFTYLTEAVPHIPLPRTN